MYLGGLAEWTGNRSIRLTTEKSMRYIGAYKVLCTLFVSASTLNSIIPLKCGQILSREDRRAALLMQVSHKPTVLSHLWPSVEGHCNGYSVCRDSTSIWSKTRLQLIYRRG